MEWIYSVHYIYLCYIITTKLLFSLCSGQLILAGQVLWAPSETEMEQRETDGRVKSDLYDAVRRWMNRRRAEKQTQQDRNEDKKLAERNEDEKWEDK